MKQYFFFWKLYLLSYVSVFLCCCRFDLDTIYKLIWLLFPDIFIQHLEWWRSETNSNTLVGYLRKYLFYIGYPSIAHILPTGPPPPLKNHKNIGFLCNTGLDPLKITELPSQQSILDHHLHASEMPFKWRFTGGPMMASL